MATRDSGHDPEAVAPVQLRVRTDLPPLPPIDIPAPGEGIAGDAGASWQQLETPVDGDAGDDEAAGVELAEAIVELTDAAVGLFAYGLEHDGPVATPPAKRKVARAMIRAGSHLGPAAGAAAVAIPEPVIDGGALVIWSAVAWGGPLLLALQRWRAKRAEDRSIADGYDVPGGADRGGGPGPYPGAAPGRDSPGRPGAPVASYPDRPGGDLSDYSDRLAAALARPSGSRPADV